MGGWRAWQVRTVAGVVPDDVSGDVPDEDVEPALEEVENGGRLVVDSEVLGAPTA